MVLLDENTWQLLVYCSSPIAGREKGYLGQPNDYADAFRHTTLDEMQKINPSKVPVHSSGPQQAQRTDIINTINCRTVFTEMLG